MVSKLLVHDEGAAAQREIRLRRYKLNDTEEQQELMTRGCAVGHIFRNTRTLFNWCAE